MSNNHYDGLAEHYCPICGGIFFPTAVHRYKASHKLYCSWTCYNRRNVPIPGKRGKVCKAVEQMELNGEHVRYFNSGAEAADHINGTPEGMYTACNGGKAYKGYLWRYVT